MSDLSDFIRREHEPLQKRYRAKAMRNTRLTHALRDLVTAVRDATDPPVSNDLGAALDAAERLLRDEK